MYTEKELKEGTQIVYLSFLSDAAENMRMDGIKPPFSVMDMIKSCMNVQSAFDAAIADGMSQKDIRFKDLVKYSDLKDSDKSIIEEFSPEMFDWKIVDIQDMNSLNGFFSCCIETSEKEAMIAFRGSENMKEYTNMVNDWARADFGLLNSRSTRQQEEAEKYGEYLLEKGLIDKYDSLAITGHSLGGNLASHFTIASAESGKEKLFNKIKQSINWDGPGVSDEYLSEHQEKIEKAAPKLTRYKWSAVGTLLFDIPGEHSEFLGINEDLYKDDPKERIKYKVITRHSTKSLMFDENGKAERGKQDLVSKGLSSFSKAIDKFVPEHITTEIFAAADWIFERILRIKDERNIEFNDVSWAERFAKKGSILGTCVNFINKTVDVFKEGALALENEISELFSSPQMGYTPKLALADVHGGMLQDYNYNRTFERDAEKNIDWRRKNQNFER
ncbi:MAG: DUF2974 domain-containing protein [Clostridia bacterium]|nr:DUF2974 domain-containing protein [Clostridia bacterium]